LLDVDDVEPAVVPFAANPVAETAVLARLPVDREVLGENPSAAVAVLYPQRIATRGLVGDRRVDDRRVSRDG